MVFAPKCPVCGGDCGDSHQEESFYDEETLKALRDLDIQLEQDANRPPVEIWTKTADMLPPINRPVLLRHQGRHYIARWAGIEFGWVNDTTGNYLGSDQPSRFGEWRDIPG
jgi:hypothetical protein